MAKIRVLLIEDNCLLREGLTELLNAEEDMKVMSFSSVGDVYEQATMLTPDVLLVDLNLSQQNSLEVVGSIKKQYLNVPIVVMDLIPPQAGVVEFVRAGVRGFILKDATLRDFLKTIRSVAKGEKVLPAPMADSLFSQIVEHALQAKDREKLLSAIKLTKREQEVLSHMAAGRSDQEIPGEINIAVITVKNHTHNVLRKMAILSRLELATSAQ